MNPQDLAELARTLFEESGDALFLFDPDSEQLLDVNPMAQRLSGHSRTELLRLRVDYLFRSEMPGGLRRLRLAYHKPESFHSQEGYLLRHRQDGVWVSIHLTVSRLHLPGRSLGLITARDVTSQRHTQHLLEQKEAELRAVLASVSDCLWSADVRGGSVQVRYCSPVAERLTARPAEFFLRGLGAWVEVSAPEDRPRVEAALARLQAGSSTCEEVEHRIGGSPRWVRSSVLARPQSGGVRLDGVVSDITEAVQRRELVQASQARYRTLLENLEQSIFLKDDQLRFVAANRRFCEGAGRAEADLVGATDFDLYPPELAAKYRDDDLRVLRLGSRVELEEQTLIEDRRRWVRVIKTPVRDSVGHPVGVLGIFWDVTEQRELQEQLRQAARMEAVGQLAGGVAHDFNNLLTAILGNLALLRLAVGPGGAVELIDAAEKAAWRAATLTSQLLSFSRRGVLRCEPVDVNRTLEEVRGLLQSTIDPRIGLEMRPAIGLWPIRGDAAQLCQVALNLALNARDAVQDVLDREPSAGVQGAWIRLETTNVTLGPADVAGGGPRRPGEFVRLRVRDSGGGIPADVLPRIFEPFYTTKAAGKGTGLGLAMVFGIAQQHGGWVECHSQPGRGATFEVHLPRCAEEARPPLPPPRSGAAGGTETILLVDDEPLLLNFARSVLLQHGYQVMLASDGLQAVELYRDAGPGIDLVLLDRTMPRLSGRDTLRQLRQLDPQVAVLFASGYAADELTDEERTAVRGFLSKPYSPEELLAVVRAALDAGAHQL